MNTLTQPTKPNRLLTACGLAVELGVWATLLYLIVARRNFAALPLIALIATLAAIRLLLNGALTGNIKGGLAGPLAVLFPPPLRWPLAALSALLAMSFWLTLQYDLAVPRLWMFVMGFVTLSVIYNLAWWANRSTWGIWLIALGWLSFATVIAAGGALTASWVFLKISLLQRLSPGYEMKFVQLANDQTTNVNIVAGVLSPIVLVPIGLMIGLLVAAKAKYRVLYYVGAAITMLFGLLLLGVLLLTQSFGAYGALAAGMGVFVALRYRKFGWVLAAALALGIIAALLYLPTLLTLSPEQLDVLLRKRYYIWLRALLMIGDMPLSGIGLGMFPSASRLLFSNMITSITDQPPHAHNILLELGLDFGIIGIACFVWLQIALWRIGLRAIGSAPQTGMSLAYTWALRGLLAGQAMWLVFNLTDLAYPGTRASFIYWGVWGLVLAFSNKQRSVKEF